MSLVLNLSCYYVADVGYYPVNRLIACIPYLRTL